MPFFQNVFDNDFYMPLLLEDRQYVIDFKVPANFNKSIYQVAWAEPPYNTVGNTTLTINYSLDAGKTFYPLALTLSSGATKTADDLAADLNAIANFASLFEAKVAVDKQGVRRLFLQAKQQREYWRCYISNTSAETVLRFNAKAGVAEGPSFFSRHTIANYKLHGPTGDNLYPDSLGMLIELTSPTDDWYITNAGLSTTAQEDWELLRGRSQAFKFRKQAVDGTSRVTQIIEYPAGAKEGDLAKKIIYNYTAAQTAPDEIMEIPYVLEAADLITP